MVYQWGFERDIEFLHEVEIYGMIRTSHLSLANIGSCYNPVILERFMHIIWFGKKAFEYVRYMLCLFLYTRPEDFEPAVLECVNHWPAEKDTATMANCSYVIAITDPGIKSSLPSHVQMSETTLWFLHSARSPISPDARAATLFWSGGDVVSVSSCLALIVMGYKSVQLLLPAGRTKKALVSAALQLLIRRPTSANCWRSWSAHGVSFGSQISTQQVSNSSIDHLLEYSCNAGSIRCNLSFKLACVAQLLAETSSVPSWGS